MVQSARLAVEEHHTKVHNAYCMVKLHNTKVDYLLWNYTVSNCKVHGA